MATPDKNYPVVPTHEYEDGEPDPVPCRECKVEWDPAFIEPNGLCPLCF